MKRNNSKTSFKIGGTIGIMILLLGITVMFGVFQMSKVSQEIIEISEEYVPLNEIIGDIRYNKSNQALKFEQIIRYTEKNEIMLAENAKEEFWSSAGTIDSKVDRAKKIIQVGMDTSSGDTKKKFQTIYQKFSNFEEDYLEYENLSRETFLSLESGFVDTALIDEIQQKENQLHSVLFEISQFLALYTDESTNQIETNERDSLIGQLLIVLTVGALAGTLGFFLNQINNDLKKEVELKTTELKKANEKLRELDKMKDEFIGIASHELKSPIQPIFGFAELAKSGGIDQKEAWDGVIQLATKLQDLANDLLDVSKIESKRLKLQKEKFPINDFILEIIQPFKINLKPGIAIQTNLDKNVPVEADKIRVGQVFRNILDNAVKFTKKGNIEIKTRVFEEENKIIFEISDPGIGISNDILPKIFEKFVTKSDNAGGTGLGLFLCKGIVEEHGGKISAKNNREGGATFEFSLPIQFKEKISEPLRVFTN